MKDKTIKFHKCFDNDKLRLFLARDENFLVVEVYTKTVMGDVNLSAPNLLIKIHDDTTTVRRVKKATLGPQK